MSDHDYKPKSKVGQWFNDRLPLLTLANHLTDYPTPKNLNYWWTFGGILTFCLITQIITGLTLAMHYIAHADLIFEVSNQGKAASIKIADNIATTPRSLSGTDLNIA